MKATICAALTLAMLAGHTNGVQAQSMESVSERADKALAVALWQIGVATHTRIGFQSVEAIKSVSGMFRFHDGPTAIVSSLDDAIDAAIATNPRYEWRRVGDFVVVRPADAWNATADPFNRPVRHFRAERTNESQVLHGISKLIETGSYQEAPLSGTPVDFTVESGTLIEVLNTLAESAEIALWQVGCAPHGDGQRLSLSLTLVNDRHLRAFIHRPSIPMLPVSSN